MTDARKNPAGHTSGSTPYIALPTVTSRPGAGAMPEGKSFVEQYARPELASHETKAARERVGEGELLRAGAKARHVCEVLDLYRSPKLDVGAVWRCDCGKRWTYVKNAANVRSWQRRFWPWPR